MKEDRRLRAWCYLGVAVTSVVLIAACGSSGRKATPPTAGASQTPSAPPSGQNGTSPTTSSDQPVGKGYLASDDATFADFIQ